MTLYRIDLKDPDVAFPGTIAWLIGMGVLVPIEPCEHGNYDEHWLRWDARSQAFTQRCPGARIGEAP